MFKKYSAQLAINEGLNQLKVPGGLFNHIRGFAVVSFGSRRSITLETNDYETGLVILRGKCDININGKDYKGLGERSSVFSGKPTGVYIPIRKKYTISAQDAEVAICSSRCDKDSDFAVINPSDITEKEVGKDNWQRLVRMIIGPGSSSVNLIVGETLNPPGNWSGTPAHKHEKTSPSIESLHEELYYFKTDKPQGFGIQRLYSPERNMNELIYLKEDTVTFMPWGYHQIVAGPGYILYYLFFLSGAVKDLFGFVDPEHKWIVG